MYYELTLKHDDEQTGKTTTERYIIKDCNLFAEAECKGMGIYDGDCDVVSIKRSRIYEFANDNQVGGEIFIANIADVFHKDDGSEKELIYMVGIWANDISYAQKVAKDYISQGLSDMKLKGINQTKFIDVV